MAVRDSTAWEIMRSMSHLRKYQNLPNLKPGSFPLRARRFNGFGITAEKFRDFSNS